MLNKKVREHIKNQNLSLDYLNLSFLTLFTILGGIVAPLYLVFNGIHLGPIVLCFALYCICGLSITMGYHRLFSHKTFNTNPIIESILLLFGAMAMQNSALKWSSDHRVHHQFTDTEKDPYNAELGFWWSHFLWIIFIPKGKKNSVVRADRSIEGLKKEFPNVPDLVNNPLVRFQHRFSVIGGFALSMLVPLVFGLYFGHVLEYILVAGFLRILVLHHSTFFINSLAHIVGHSTYSERTTAKDSFWVALLSLGEGYHNFHHSYPNDYRNGVKPYHFDPTKWVIRTLSYIGMTRNLKQAKITN